MSKSAHLIQTKINPPFTRPALVPRTRLSEKIIQGLRGPITLVVAPAGFGKTTLVTSLLSNLDLPIAWISLDKNDNQPGRFLTYLIAAFHAADPRIGNEASLLMAGIQSAQPEAILTTLINDLYEIDIELVLVLDDYHLISSKSVHEELTFLLDHQPGKLHLVIASRSDPPLQLPRFRARGQVLEIRGSDLRFTEEEASLFLNEIMGFHLDKHNISILEERTEGWITGLQMAALSMRDRDDVQEFIHGFSGTNRYILDYLIEEVLSSQSPEIQQFLLYTSILERLSAPLCDALMDYNNFQNIIQPPLIHPNQLQQNQSTSALHRLERDNLFLVSLDDERIWYRYHHLFANLLKVRLHQTLPELIPILHKRASAWFELNGFYSESIQHMLFANEASQAADLIERYGPVCWADSELSVIQMSENLPHQLLVERPKIGLYYAWLLINQGNIEKAYPLLVDLSIYLSTQGSDANQKWIEMIVLLALAFLSPPSSRFGMTPLPDSDLLDKIPADEIILRDAADLLLGMALIRRGKIDQVVEFSIKSMEKQRIRAGINAIPTLVPFLAAVYIFLGRLHTTMSFCTQYLDLIEEKGIRISTAGNLDVIKGVVLYEWNRLDDAEKCVRYGLKANEPWGNIMTDAFGLLALTQILRAKGNYAEAMQIVDTFETRLKGRSRPVEFGEDYRTLRVQVNLSWGKLDEVSDWLEKTLHSEDYQTYKDYYRQIIAYIRLAQENYSEVERILSEPPSIQLHGNELLRQIESNLILACAMAGSREVTKAFNLLQTSLSLAEPEGYIRVFLNIGEPVHRLLIDYLKTKNPIHPQFCHRILTAFSSESAILSHSNETFGLIEPLSDREIEVLHLLALGKTNQEIADELIVARGTIKAHAANIYRKLEVTNRTEAVNRARQLGILD